jgi:thioredoxin-like negative regulator of GroEL
MDSLIAHLTRKERGRLSVTCIDVDAKPELAEQFRVEVVPTIVLVMEKRTVARLEGRVSAPKIERLIEQHVGS